MMFSIFQINHGDGIKSWICAKSNIHALKTYESHTDVGLVDYDCDDSIEELPKSEWGNYTITREDTEEKQTFENFMRYASQAEIIAENNY